MNNWINIKDQLPDVGQTVVFTCDIDGDFTHPSIGEWNNTWSQGDTIIMLDEDDDFASCSHWIEIPELPYY